MKRIGLRSIALFLSVCVLAACTPKQGLTLQSAWARPGLTGGNSAVYFEIQNPFAEEDLLLKAECTAAASTELHMSMMDASGNMMMQPQENVPIPAQGQVSFKPGGLHVMLIGLTQDLNAGDTLALTLTFQNAGTLQLEVPIKTP